MKRSSHFAVHKRNKMITFVSIMLLCLMAVNGFSMGGIRSARPTQSRTFRVAASSRSNAAYPIAETTLLESIPKSKRTPEENDKVEEEAVDEYLEFLDRRYRRLREKETKGTATQIKTPFSALNWLKQEQLTDAIISEQIQDDALYVLGVAGLASKRLLHKHHIPESFINPMGRPLTQDAIDVSSSSANAVDQPSSSASSTAPKGKTTVEVEKFIARVTEARRALISYQTRKLLAALKAVLNAPSSLMKKLWATGGGKRSLAIAVTLASVLTIALIRPLLISLGKVSLDVVRSS